MMVDHVQNEQVNGGEWFYTSGDDHFSQGPSRGTVTVVRPGRTVKEILRAPAEAERAGRRLQ
jgi:hypothetical protein